MRLDVFAAALLVFSFLAAVLSGCANLPTLSVSCDPTGCDATLTPGDDRELSAE